jgi:hypothetical protein
MDEVILLDTVPEKRSSQVEWVLAIGLLTALALLAYGPSLTQLGFYRDDWYVLWAGRAHGPEIIPVLFSTDRPVMGQLYSLTYRLLGEDRLAWQVYALGLRWAGAVLTLVIGRAAWPGRRLQTAAVAALMLLYPGFLQQPNAMTFSNQLMTYTAALLSIALTALAFRTRRAWVQVVLTLLSLATALFYQLLYEYMIGLEAARLALIWILTRDEPSRRARAQRALLRWLPYVAVILCNIAWRTFIFESERQTTNLGGLVTSYLANPLRMGALQGFELAKDLVEILFVGWLLPLYELSRALDLRTIAAALALAASAVGLAMLYRWQVRRTPSLKNATSFRQSPESAEMLLLGGVALIGAQIPVILALRDAHWSSGFDRYTLQATLGTALLAVALLGRYVRHPLRLILVLGLIGLSVGTHFLNGRAWAEFWDAERELWWQMSWRAPQLQPGTTLLVQMPGEGYYEDYEVWGPANLLYYPEATQVRVGAEVFTENTVDKVRVGASEIRNMRKIIDYPRDYEKVLVLARPSVASCVHVLDGARLELPASPGSLVRVAGRFSHIGQIDVRSSEPPIVPVFFGPQPDSRWCTFYQKALLARQLGNWGEVVRLADQVEGEGLKPGDLSEWLPFIEGYALANRTDEARELASRLRSDSRVRHSLCDEISGVPPAGVTLEAYQRVTRLVCEFD